MWQGPQSRSSFDEVCRCLKSQVLALDPGLRHKQSTSAGSIGCLHDYDYHDDDDDDDDGDDDHAENDNDIEKDIDTERSPDGKAQTCRQSQQF